MRATQLEDAIELIKMEFLETPRLRLTFWQAQRLWDIPEDVCQQAFTTLARSGFLKRLMNDVYVSRNVSSHL
jgi:hypothetical protein